MNIGDGNGSGQDHCELLGGSEASATVAGDYMNSPSASGTYMYTSYIKHNTKGAQRSWAFLDFIYLLYSFIRRALYRNIENTQI